MEAKNIEPQPIDARRLQKRKQSLPMRGATLSFKDSPELRENQPPTSYLETMMHLFKGNVGTGCYAMADAMMNGGIIVGPVLTLIIAIICVHTQHMLINCADVVMKKREMTQRPDYAETVLLSFEDSNHEKWRKIAPILKTTCNVFICITQLGFCCVYLLFIGKNLKDVLDYYGHTIDLHLLVAIILIPVWITTLIRTLKYIAIFSAIANICMVLGIFLTVGYAAKDLPSISERHFYGKLETLPLFFGTALFAFEGIALVLPLQNAMKNPNNFSKPWGVLNVGMVFVTVIYIIVGTVGYWQYGEATQGSLTLNLPTKEILAQVIKLMIAVGIMLGYAIQFYVAIQIMFSSLSEKSKLAVKYPVITELIFRTLMVLTTFAIAELVPNLSLLLSLIGSVCCVVLAFVFPALSELIIRHNDSQGISGWCLVKNIIILLIALAGFIFGGVLSLQKIYFEIVKNFEGLV